MTLLSLDQDPHHTGYCVFDPQDEVLLYFGLLKASSVREMVAAINDLLDEAQPELLVCEDVFVGKSKRDSLTLGALLGSVQTLAELHDIGWLEPAHLQEVDRAMHSKYPKGQRKATLQRMARLASGYALPNHIADAYWIGLAALTRLKLEALAAHADG